MPETTKTLSILALVEDEADIRALIRMTLRPDPRLELKGEAASAEEAIELVREIQPDLIILDHSLEGQMTGLEAAPVLKEVAPGGKILLFTAYDMKKEAEHEPAIDAFLRKDNFPRLLRTVEDLLGIGPVTT